MSPASFVIIGGASWRAQFFLRVAREFPELFRCAGVVVRDAERGRAVQERWGVAVHPTLDGVLTGAGGRPEFAVVSVSKGSAPGIMGRLAEAGVAVLCETPPGGTVEELAAVWGLVERGARIQVAEQYIFQPEHAARLALVRAGVIGEATYAQVSGSHGYHNVSLIRHYLDVGMRACTISATRLVQPITRGSSRAGPPTVDERIDCPHVLATLDFGGRVALYDWAENQHRSYIRSTHTLVRGERGEIRDGVVRYLEDHRTPVMLPLVRQEAGQGANLEGMHLKGITAGAKWWYRNPLPVGFEAPRLLDDELAVAEVMVRMVAYVRGGAEVYPLAAAGQDTYLALLIEEAVRAGRPVSSSRQPWQG